MNIKGILFFALTTAFLSGCDDSKSESPAPEPDITLTSEYRLTKTIDEYLEGKIDNSTPGLAMIVRHEGQIVYQTAMGLANDISGLTIQDHTPFKLASVSKPFTAVAIMQLVEQQQIELQASVRTYLPELPESWQDITIHHLLTHQSGIPIRNVALNQDGTRAYTNDHLLYHYSQDDSLDFEPGEQFEYRTAGYIVLAEVIAQVTGEEFEVYMERNIFTPTNMNNSSVVHALTRPFEYWSDAMALSQGDDDDVFLGLFNGGIGQVGSVEDLNSFVEALLAGDVIQQSSLEQIFQPHVLVNSQTYYGYGWVVQEFSDKLLYRHMGRFAGYSTGIEIYPTDEVEIIYVSNGGDVTNLYKAELINIVREHYGLFPNLVVN